MNLPLPEMRLTSNSSMISYPVYQLTDFPFLVIVFSFFSRIEQGQGADLGKGTFVRSLSF